MSDKMNSLIKNFSDSFKRDPAFGFSAPDVRFVETRLISLDNVVFGCGGLPRGKVIIFVGWESTGKSLLCHYMAGQFQQQDPDFTVAWIDLEGSFSASWAKNFGMDMTRTIIPNYAVHRDEDGEIVSMERQVCSMEDVLAQIKWAISNNVDLVVLDSIPHLTPQIVLDRNLIDRQKDLKSEASKAEAAARVTERNTKMNETLTMAKIFSQVWQKDLINGFEFRGKNYSLPGSNTSLVMINQFRTDPDKRFGTGEVEMGGNAMKFMVSVKIKMTKAGISDNRTPDGLPEFVVVGVDSVKNKVAPPFRGTELIIYWDGRVMETAAYLVNHALSTGFMERNGAWFYCPEFDIKLQGQEKAAAFLREHIQDLGVHITRTRVKDVLTDEEKEAGQSAVREEDLMALIEDMDNENN